MKRNYFVLCMLALLGSLNMHAVDFEVNGIYYTVKGDNTVSVDAGTNLYQGSVTIPSSVVYDDVTYEVTAIAANAFGYCTELTAVSIPNSVTEIGNAAFRNCIGLTTVTIPESVKTVGTSAFFGCKGLTSVNIPAGLSRIAPYMFYACEELPSVDISNVSSIGGSAFADCTSLTNVTIPESVSLIESFIFKGCTNLKTVNIPANVKTVGDAAFQGCKALTSIAIPEGVARIGRATFEGSGLTSVNIPASVKSISVSTFAGCDALSSIVVADGNTVYDSRNNCNAVIETGTADPKTGVQSLILVVGCKNSVIPEGVVEVAQNAFKGCTGLKAIEIPNSVISVGISAFEGSGLTSINIPESVKMIDEATFKNCSSLTEVVVPATLTTVGDAAFEGCTGLKKFICLAAQCPSVSSAAFKSTPVEEATLVVPVFAAEKYEAHAVWGKFGTVEEMEGNGNQVSPFKDSETALTDVNAAANVKTVYTIGGQQTSKLQRGINIVRMSDGTTRKVMVK